MCPKRSVQPHLRGKCPRNSVAHCRSVGLDVAAADQLLPARVLGRLKRGELLGRVEHQLKTEVEQALLDPTYPQYASNQVGLNAVVFGKGFSAMLQLLQNAIGRDLVASPRVTLPEGKSLVVDGFLTVDEVRELENREPLAETISEDPVIAEVASDPEENEDPNMTEDSANGA